MAGWFKSRQKSDDVEQPQAVYQDQEEPIPSCGSCGGKLHPGESDLCIVCFTYSKRKIKPEWIKTIVQSW